MAIITFFSFLSTQQTFKSNLSSAAVVIMFIAFVVSLPVSLWEMIDPIGPARTYIHVDSIETKNEIYHLTQFDDIDGMSYLVLLFRCDKSHKACLMVQNKSLNPTTAYAASQVSLSIDQDSKKLNILTDGKIFYTYDITLNFP
jgi:hypothetical protein